jgi:cyclopropane-fatty-acyl-phospholipid synthase
MWDRLLDRLLRRLIRQGALDLTYADGTTRHYGDRSAPPIRARLHDAALAGRLVRSPDLALGEAYMDGTLSIEGDNLAGVMALLLENAAHGRGNAWRFPVERAQRVLRFVQQITPARRARQNVAHHYDLSATLYDLFLDADRQYSCAYFKTPDDTLEQAQMQKKAHIAAKLRLSPGMRVLDIGCGWGGMALTLARDHGCRVLGVTLSEEQHRAATARAAAAGLEGQVEFRLTDYRAVTGTFDRIVSVGMFEHVGLPQYQTYFDRVRALLAPDGVALIHTIGRAGPPSITSPWITKYIFPGGYAPALSEIMPAVQASGLWTTDIEVWRLHYAETLRHWRLRFEANIDAIRALYDDRFCRMWRYYLVASEMTFRNYRQCVFQIQLSHRQEAVPLTRDYLYHDDP